MLGKATCEVYVVWKLWGIELLHVPFFSGRILLVYRLVPKEEGE